MEKFRSIFFHLQSSILYLLLFLFPFFFLTTTQEFFSTNKMYLLAFGGLILLLLSVGELIISKKLVWQKNMFDGPVVLFLLTVGLSIVMSSPNKIQALLNPSFGLLGLLGLVVLYFYISRINGGEMIGGTAGRAPDDAQRSEHRREGKLGQNLSFLSLQISALILSLVTIVFFFQPFQKINLPGYLAFLKSPGFTPLGNPVDLGIMLGFFVVYGFVRILKEEQIHPDKKLSPSFIFHLSSFILTLLALALTVYSVLKPISTSFNQFQPVSTALPPFNLSWYAAVEILKNPLTALFGVGVDNFASMFTKVKDILYNQSALWQINSFTVSRSALLHIFTETGLFGIVAFGILVFGVLKKSLSSKQISFETAGFVFVLLMMALFPPSLLLFFLFFLMVAFLARDNTNQDIQSYNLSEVLPLYLGSILISLIMIGVMGYLLGRTYVGEYYFKKGLDGIAKNNLKDLYDNQRQAIIMNPFIERYRINFSQTNLLIANNIAAKVESNKSNEPNKSNLSDQDRQTVAQAIQAAIAEAKAAVSLNPQKAANWENLAAIYRNILNVAAGADVWTISAYQRAIVLDPENAQYRLNLGGVYYSLNKYDEAANLFQQTITLKPDWANGHYNLAWTSYQKADYQQAVSEMQTVVSLLNPQKDQSDYQKAQTDLEGFKKKLPQAQEQASPAAQIKQPSKLSIPTLPVEKISPPITLPKSASPEAK